MSSERLETPVDCGCAPTPAEQSRLFGSVTRRSALTIGAFGLVAASALAAPFVPAAMAIAGYPSWDDVQRAKSNESAKASEVTRIEGLIQQLTDDVAYKQAEAQRLGDEYYVAQQAYFEAAARADSLQAQADEQEAKATEAAQKAGVVAAQLYRNGGDDTSLELFFSDSAATADDLLARLGTMDKLIEANRAVYTDAVTARDTAKLLGEQAVAARDERDRLQQEAEQKMIAAQEAAAAAEAALANQQQYLGTLQAQLAALKDTTAKTVADYQAGVEAERKAREEAERRAREEAARKAAEEAARLAAENAANGGGGGGGGGGGAVQPSGWVRPSNGWISSGYGPRSQQCNNSYCSTKWHYGLDFAGGCGTVIYAATSGRVVYAGPNGGYGNYVKIDHGGGTGTGYGHIQNGGIAVRYGQQVSAGQVIAYVGNTGNSFGCHLHFEVYRNGGTTDPAPFLRARGAL